MTPAALADSSVEVSMAPNGCTSKNEEQGAHGDRYPGAAIKIAFVDQGYTGQERAQNAAMLSQQS
ncbi:hypothetical protein [Xanthomonas nasturtii]|uniref:hypothetical protein n=1 Tax=Xanthomonas nasturtii TaxID=1843581 RepID=UPI002B238BD5|nr:hypothetical protein [Xanthomonas nasturtii]